VGKIIKALRAVKYYYKGRNYSISVAGKKTRVYRLVGAKGTTWQKVRSAKEAVDVLSAYNAVLEKQIAKRNRAALS